MGHRAEARAALLAYFNAQPTGKMRAETHGADYQISVVRYFGDGSEEPFFTMEGSTNIEFDDWGLALWALREYLRHRLAGAAIGRQQDDLRLRMAQQQAHQFGAGITGCAEYPDFRLCGTACC